MSTPKRSRSPATPRAPKKTAVSVHMPVPVPAPFADPVVVPPPATPSARVQRSTPDEPPKMPRRGVATRNASQRANIDRVARNLMPKFNEIAAQEAAVRAAASVQSTPTNRSALSLFQFDFVIAPNGDVASMNLVFNGPSYVSAADRVSGGDSLANIIEEYPFSPAMSPQKNKRVDTSVAGASGSVHGQMRIPLVDYDDSDDSVDDDDV